MDSSFFSGILFVELMPEGKAEHADSKSHRAKAGSIYVNTSVFGNLCMAVNIRHGKREGEQDIHCPVQGIESLPAKQGYYQREGNDSNQQIILADFFLLFLAWVFDFWIDFFL